MVSLVAERRGAIVGHVLFSRMDVEADGAPLSGAGLAPVSVLPEQQGQGIGDALIRAGLDALREQGMATSFVLGHESYYPRFGYSPELAARFASPFAGPHFMAMMLDSGATWPPRRTRRITHPHSAGWDRAMSFNSFGRVLRFTTWGESHGPALGAVVDGCPPRLSLSEADIQPFPRQAPPRPVAPLRRSGRNPIKCASCRAPSRARPPARRSA